ncbi:hypothetical protein CVT24_006092, partial [Panaeolus cyanescens]
MSRAYEDHEEALLLGKEQELGKTKEEERWQYPRDKKKKHVEQQGFRQHPPSSLSALSPHVSSGTTDLNNGVSGQDRSRLSFEALGLDKKFVAALRTAFPDVIQPTEVQEKLIPELLGGKDILLKDCTGSGKSFGLVLALLSKPRIAAIDQESGRKRRFITSLLIVPHRDLGHQFADWIKRLVDAIPLDERPTLESVVQVLVRGGDKTYRAGIEQLKKEPPHILICTPQAFLDVHRLDGDVLGVDTLQAVVVDEVDYLVETAARKDPKKSFKKAHDKAKRAIARHPGETRQILDMIYARRKELAEMDEEYEDEEGYRRRAAWRCSKEKEENIPQLIMSSATLRVHLRDYLFEESGWLNRYNLVKVFGKGKEVTPRGILHSVLVVGQDEQVRNIEEAIAGAEEEVMNDSDILEVEEDVSVEWNGEYERTKSPFDANVMETIATCFALDVARMGLVVLGSSEPVGRAVYELRQLGVDAHGLEYWKGAEFNSGSKGKLLVGTVATTRGIDFGELGHVFIVGLPYCGVGDIVTNVSLSISTTTALITVTIPTTRQNQPTQLVTVVPAVINVTHTISPSTSPTPTQDDPPPSSSSSPEPTPSPIILATKVDPAFAVLGVILILTGLPSAFWGHKNRWTSFFLIGFYTLSLVCIVLILKFGVIPAINPPSRTLRGMFVLSATIAGIAG